MINKLSLSLLVIFLNLCAISESLLCEKLNFDKSSLTGIETCEWSVPFIISQYSDLSSTIPLFQPTSEYVLSANVQGAICADSLATYTLDEYSEIEVAYFLTFIDNGAFFRVELFDENNVSIFLRVFEAKTTDWNIFKINFGLTSTLTQCSVSCFKNVISIYIINFFILRVDETNSKCQYE